MNISLTNNNTVYFDFDGTIVDVFPRYYGVLSSYVEKITDQELDFTLFKTFKRSGMKDHQIVNCIIPDIKFDIEEYLTFKRNELENLDWLYKDTIIGDFNDAYVKLKAKGYKIVLITQRNNKQNLFQQVKLLELVKYFDDIVVVKPRAGANVKIDYLKEKVCADDVIIGDSKVEIEVANKLNISGYFVNTGLFSSEFLAINERVFDNYNSVVNYICQ